MTITARRLVRHSVVVLALTACLAAFAPAQDDVVAPDASGAASRPAEADDPGPIRRFVYLDEDFELNDLVHKAQFFEDQDNWAKAFQIYHDVLQRANETTLVRLDDRTFGNLRGHVRRRLASMPAARLHQYRVLYDAAAKRLLEEALTPLSPDRLERVATQYFATASGDDALDILGDVYREEGQWRRAVDRWRQVLEVYPDTDLPRPYLWAKVAAGYVALREGRRASEALGRLREIAGAEARLDIAGTPTSLVTVLAPQIARLGDLPATTILDRSTWPQIGGTAQHVGAGPEPGPTDVRTWVFRLPAPAKATRTRTRSSVSGRVIQAPGIGAQMCPVAADGVVFVHDRRNVYAINGATGKVIWSRSAALSPVAADAAVRRLTRYSSVGSAYQQTACAVDGGTVYAALGGGASAPKIVALDQKTGQVKWAEPVPVGSDKRPAAMVSTSEVVVAAGVVFVRIAAATSGANVHYSGGHLDHHVVAFDARTGEVLWNRFVCTAASLYYRYSFPGVAAPGSQLSMPAADEQRVYICTNGGAVAALDARTGEVVWATLYEKSKVDRSTRTRMLIMGMRSGTSGAAGEPPWRSSAPLILDGRVFFSPADADALFCLDAETGRLLWQRPRDGGQFVVGALENRLFVAGKAVEAVDAATGKTIWRRARPALKPTGHPFLTETVLFVPTEDRLYRYDTRSGKVAGAMLFDRRHPAEETGSLVWTGQTLVIASTTAINGFGDRTKVVAVLAKRIEDNPRDAEAYFQLGEIYARSQQYEPAIQNYEQGLAVCPPNTQYQSSRLQDVFRDRLYEHHQAATGVAAGKRQFEPALAHAKASLTYATRPDRRLKAKLLMVRSFTGLNDWSEAANVWQSILLDEPRVEYQLADASSTTAGSYARSQLRDLLAAHGRPVYAAHDAAANRLLEAGGRKSLERILAGYPNSLAYPNARLALGDVLFKADDFERAASQYRRYLRACPPRDRARAYVKIVESQIKAGRGIAARRWLDRLLAERPEDTVSADGRGMGVKAYVASRLVLPAVARAPKPGELVLPSLALPLTRSWTKPFPNARFIDVKLDAARRNEVYFVSGSTLVCLDTKAGKRRWLLAVPRMTNIQRHVSDGASILVASNDRVASVNLAAGEVEWIRSLPEPKAAAADPAGRKVIVQGGVRGVVQLGVPQRLRVYVAGLALSDEGALVVRRRYLNAPGRSSTTCEALLLDRETGEVRWTRSFPGYPAHTPLLIEDTALVLVQNPNKVLALETDDGAVRHEWKFANTVRLLGVPLVISPDEVCLVAGTGLMNDVMAIDLQQGGTTWKRRITSRNSTHQPVTLHKRGDRILYVPRRDACSALAARDGRILWRTPYPGDVTYQTHVVVGEEAIFAAGYAMRNGKQTVKVTRIDAAKGGVTWSIQMPETGQARDVKLTADEVLVVMTPQRVTTRQVGQRKIQSRIGLPPQVYLINQDDGQVEAVLKVSRQGANSRFTHQPAYLAVSDGHAVISHYGGLVGFGPAKKPSRSGT